MDGKDALSLSPLGGSAKAHLYFPPYGPSGDFWLS